LSRGRPRVRAVGAHPASKPVIRHGLRVGSPITMSIVSKGLEAITLALLVTLVPRLLGTDDYGRFALASAVVAVAASSVGLGGPTLLSRFIPAADPAKRAGLAFALLQRLVGLRIVQMLLVAFVGVVLTILQPARAPALLTGLVVLAITLEVGATLAFQTTLAFGRTTLWSLRVPIQNLVLLAVLPILYQLGGTAGAIASISVAAGTIMLIGAVSVVGRVAPPPLPLPPGIVRFGLLQAMSSVFAQARQRGGVFAVAVLGTSAAEIGFTALAINIALAATFAVAQIFSVELPRLAERIATSPASTLASAQSLSRRLMVAITPVALASALLLDDLVPILAGESFQAGVEALAPALAVVPLAPLTALTNQVAALRLRSEVRLLSNVVGTVVFAVAAVIAVPAWDAAGGSAAFLAGSAATASVGALAFRDVVGIRRLGVALAASFAVLIAGLA
jgi:O-antigen/teichoic acid export membrane protein